MLRLSNEFLVEGGHLFVAVRVVSTLCSRSDLIFPIPASSAVSFQFTLPRLQCLWQSHDIPWLHRASSTLETGWQDGLLSIPKADGCCEACSPRTIHQENDNPSRKSEQFFDSFMIGFDLDIVN